MTEPRIYERTVYEARLDAAYGACFNDLNARFFRRADFMFGFIGLFGGTTVFTTVLSGWQAVALAASALVAACAILERLIRPAEMAMRHDAQRALFGDLLASIDANPGMRLQEVDAALRRLQSSGPSGLHALAATAYNRTVSAHGRTDYLMAVSGRERIMALLA